MDLDNSFLEGNIGKLFNVVFGEKRLSSSLKFAISVQYFLFLSISSFEISIPELFVYNDSLTKSFKISGLNNGLGLTSPLAISSKK